MKTLLEQAKEVELEREEKNSEGTEEQLEIVLAYLRGEIRAKQATRVLGVNGGALEPIISRNLKWAYRTGRLIQK